MAIEVVSEVWSLLKRYVSSVDRSEAAEELVAILIDHDYSADDIREEFSDSDVKKALTPYLEHRGDDSEYDDEEDDYEESFDEEDEDY